MEFTDKLHKYFEITCLKLLAYLINNGNWSPIGVCYYLTRRALKKKIINHLADK